MERFVCLLRGINVGGNKLVKMAELKVAFEVAGFDEVRTLLQSGNVVFSSRERDSEAVLDRLRAKLPGSLGVSCDLFIRSLREIEQLIASNPFPDEAIADPSHLLVVFLDSPPSREETAAVSGAIVGRERIAALEREIVVAYPDGIGDSKVTKTPGWNKLIGPGSARNWNTVLKIEAALKGI